MRTTPMSTEKDHLFALQSNERPCRLGPLLPVPVDDTRIGTLGHLSSPAVRRLPAPTNDEHDFERSAAVAARVSVVRRIDFHGRLGRRV